MIALGARRALVVLLAFLVASIAAGLPGGAQSDPPATDPSATEEPATTGPPETADDDPAIDDLVACVQGSRHLLVLFLIDESASLKQTDPDDRRVDAAAGALDSLVSLATAEGGSAPQVDVALAAFSNEYRPVLDWTTASDDTASELNESLEQFADFNSGIDTDFVNALSAGREALADQAAAVTIEGGAAPCRAVLLFTDGGYDLAVRETDESQERLGTTKPYAPGIELTTPEDVEAAERAGRTELCREGGLADRVRNDEITLLTVALSGDVARRSQLPLAAASTGKADDYTCGTQTERPQGAYLPAEGVDVLITRFNEVGNRLAGGSRLEGDEELTICGDATCDAGSRTFTLDQSLRRAQILALAPGSGIEVEVTSPAGDTVRLSEPGSQSVGATPLVIRDLVGRGLIVDMERPDDPAAWDGDWTVALVDRSRAQEGETALLQVYVFSDLAVAFGENEPLERGADSAIEALLVVPEEVDASSVIDEATATVRFRDATTGAIESVELDGPPTGPYTGTFTTPADTTVNALSATVELRIVTSTGAELVSQSAPTELLVRRSGDAVQFLPASLKFPSLTGTGSSETDLILTGGESTGCVWFGPSDVPDLPEGAGAIRVLVDGEPLPDEASCLTVPAGETVTVSVQASPDGRASGTVRGTLEVFERTESADTASQTQVPFRLDLARGVDETRRLILAVLLLLAGLAIPLLALLAINALTARFQTLDVVRGSALPVQVAGGSVKRVDGEWPRPLSLRDGDFGSLANKGDQRRFRFGGVEFRARASRNPFGATIAMAAPEGGAEKLKGRTGRRVELDPALAGSWVFLLDADQTMRAPDGTAEGLLISFVGEGAVTTQSKGMLEEINAKLPGTAMRLAGLVRSNQGKISARNRSKSAPEPDEPTVDEPTGEEPTGEEPTT